MRECVITRTIVVSVHPQTEPTAQPTTAVVILASAVQRITITGLIIHVGAHSLAVMALQAEVTINAAIANVMMGMVITSAGAEATYKLVPTAPRFRVTEHL
jgi:hypothetical protein